MADATFKIFRGDRDSGEHHQRVGLGKRGDHGPGVGFGHASTIALTGARATTSVIVLRGLIIGCRRGGGLIFGCSRLR